MMEFTSASFLKLSLQEVADRLADKLSDNLADGKDYSCAKLYGMVDGQMCEMYIVMKEHDQEIENVKI